MSFAFLKNKKVIDVVERTLATFAETFIALGIADSSGVTQLSDLKVAAIAAALAAGKYAVVQLNGFLSTSSV